MNAQELVDRVIRDARIPQGHSYRATATLLGMADDAMETLVVPELLRVAGRYLAASTDIPLVAGKSRYRLPSRALRGEHVQLLDSAGKVVEPFEHAEPANLGRYEGTTSTPQFWYFDGDVAVVRPVPATSGGYLRVTYARRPGTLVLPTAAAEVTSSSFVNGTTQEVLTGVPPVGLQSGALRMDIVSSSGAFSTLFSGAPDEVEELDPGIRWSFRFSTTQDLDVAEGDWISLAGTSPVPQVPLAYHVVLVQAVVMRVARELGKADVLADAKAALYGTDGGAGLLATARDTVAPRTRDSRVIVPMDW